MTTSWVHYQYLHIMEECKDRERTYVLTGFEPATSRSGFLSKHQVNRAIMFIKGYKCILVTPLTHVFSKPISATQILKLYKSITDFHKILTKISFLQKLDGILMSLSSPKISFLWEPDINEQDFCYIWFHKTTATQNVIKTKLSEVPLIPAASFSTEPVFSQGFSVCPSEAELLLSILYTSLLPFLTPPCYSSQNNPERSREIGTFFFAV